MRKWSGLSLLLVFVIGIAGGAVGCANLTKQGVGNDPAALTQGLASGATANANLNLANRKGR
jgi:hypothetical protein